MYSAQQELRRAVVTGSSAKLLGLIAHGRNEANRCKIDRTEYLKVTPMAILDSAKVPELEHERPVNADIVLNTYTRDLTVKNFLRRVLHSFNPNICANSHAPHILINKQIAIYVQSNNATLPPTLNKNLQNYTITLTTPNEVDWTNITTKTLAQTTNFLLQPDQGLAMIRTLAENWRKCKATDFYEVKDLLRYQDTQHNADGDNVTAVKIDWQEMKLRQAINLAVPSVQVKDIKQLRERYGSLREIVDGVQELKVG